MFYIKKVFFFLLYLNISGFDLTYYQKDRNVILNKAKDYYNKERLKKPARDKCIDLSEEERNKKKKNMGRIDIIICLKTKKIITRQRKSQHNNEQNSFLIVI